MKRPGTLGEGIQLLDEWRYFDCNEPRLANVRGAIHPAVSEIAGIFHYLLNDPMSFLL